MNDNTISLRFVDNRNNQLPIPISQIYDQNNSQVYRPDFQPIETNFFLITTPNVQDNINKLEEILFNDLNLPQEVFTGNQERIRKISLRDASRYGLVEQGTSKIITDLGYLFLEPKDELISSFMRSFIKNSQFVKGVYMFGELPMIGRSIFNGYSLDFSQREVISPDNYKKVNSN